MFTLASGLSAFAGEVKRRDIEPGIKALGKDGRTLGLEVQLRGSTTSSAVLAGYLLKAEESKSYENRATSFVPFERLSPEAQRVVLMKIFENDVVDDDGWHHTAIFSGETLWTLCKWTTDNGANYKLVQGMPENKVSGTLKKGDRVRIPFKLLSDVMKQHTVKQLPKVLAKNILEAKPVAEPMLKIEVVANKRIVAKPTVSQKLPAKQIITVAEKVSSSPDLTFKRDGQGEYAGYTIKKGETLYSSVVMRFTDYSDHADVVKAAKEVARRTAIKDMRDIDAGLKVRIPIDMLSAKYQPQGTKARVAYDKSVKKSTRLKKAVVEKKKDLSDIVVILDPGHGGEDHGAHYSRSGLYEDEINYDIVMRIKDLLQKETGAKVYMTLKDKSSGYAFNDRTRFTHDKDEMLLTNPYHGNDDAKRSGNLRCMLVNKIYDAERKRGVPARKIIFTSLHTESVMNKSHRGTKVFIPGYQYRRSSFNFGSSYAEYEEGRNFNSYKSSSSERKTDEALSRNFAVIFMDELGKHRIKRNDGGHAIRGEIRKSRSTVYVPAVLNYTKVPTKILIETANLQNATDRQRLADPWWRQEYAKAYVAALKRYYKAPTAKASVAKAAK